MSVVTEKHLYCDGCNAHFHSESVNQDSVPRLRFRAKSDGWSRRQKEGKLVDLCGHCTDKEDGIVRPVQKQSREWGYSHAGRPSEFSGH